MKRALQTTGRLLAAALLPLLGAGLYDLTAPAPAAPVSVPATAPAHGAPVLRPALLLTPSPTSSAPHVYAA
jgi:hypothetical protein